MELISDRAKSAPPLGRSIGEGSGVRFRTAVKVATFVSKLRDGKKLANDEPNCLSFHETGKNHFNENL